MKIKYQVGLELNPNGETKSSKGLIGGREISEVRKKVSLNKKRNTYLLVKFFEDKSIAEIWKLTKAEYENLHCGFGLTDFGDFLSASGLI